MEFQKVKILIIRFSSIGDIVLTTPIIRCLKEQLLGDVEIHFITKKQYGFLLENNPYINKVHTIEKSTSEKSKVLKEIGFDYVIDLHKNLRSFFVKKELKNVLSFSYNKKNIEKWVLINFGVNKMEEKHVVDRYFDTIKALGVKSDGKGLNYFIPQKDEIDVGSIGKSLSKNNYLVFVIGGTYWGKKMPAKKIVSICNNIDFPVIIVGGKEDKSEAEKIIKATSSTVFDAVGKYNLNQSASIIQHSRFVITGDTGLMHISAALNKTVISLWGCTTPNLGMSPYMPTSDSIIIEPNNLTKRPCSKLGDRCKYGNENRCITHIDNEEVSKKINKLLL